MKRYEAEDGLIAIFIVCGFVMIGLAVMAVMIEPFVVVAVVVSVVASLVLLEAGRWLRLNGADYKDRVGGWLE